ncbi:hypothetical protein PHLCEN_2v12564 [Hermanssonia centrifuga]|uniref:Uncharacterized protein n=1 Tax=Hermanssonia centrifuga TaxID=98765 RepID=A0A2R6NGN6_9APHY|nr:hypothetical protein PHLCEN_2v12564 [Hermanssonia centrifuga]
MAPLMAVPAVESINLPASLEIGKERPSVKGATSGKKRGRVGERSRILDALEDTRGNPCRRRGDELEEN